MENIIDCWKIAGRLLQIPWVTCAADEIIGMAEDDEEEGLLIFPSVPEVSSCKTVEELWLTSTRESSNSTTASFRDLD